MHRTNRIAQAVLWGVLAFPLGSWAAGDARAQEEAVPGIQGNALIVAINGHQSLQLSTKKRISTVVNRNETIARVSAVVGDPTKVLVTGLEPGITRITLVDEDKKEEAFDVVVQFDVEYLRTVLRRAVPTAKIEPIPAANNTIILTGTVGKTEDIDVVMRVAQSVVLGPDRVISQLRIGGVQQVQLCVMVAQVSRSEFRRMQFTFLNGGSQHFLASTLGSTDAVSGLANVGIATATGQIASAPGNLYLGLVNNKESFFGFLQALRDENVVKLLDEPRLMTLSGRPASFLSGGEQAIPVPAGLGQVGVQFEEFGTRLNFLPIVLGNGKIHLEVEPEVSSLDASFGTSISGTVVPGRRTQRVHTTVELEAGQTFVIGGLIQHDVTNSTTKVPVLGDLPFVGVAFRSVSSRESESELVIVVTPHLVDALDCSQYPKRLPGEETRSPDDFELFLEGIMEAPRGPRDTCDGNRYTPAFMHSTNIDTFPCGDNGKCVRGACGKTDSSCPTCQPAGTGTGRPATTTVEIQQPTPTAVVRSVESSPAGSSDLVPSFPAPSVKVSPNRPAPPLVVLPGRD